MRSLACLVLTVSALHAAPDTTALDAWLKRQPSVTSLEATFTQERKLPSLKKPVVTAGKLSLVRPDKLRWELGNPVETLAVSDGANLTLMQVAEKSARRISADSPQARQFSMLTGKAFDSPEAFRETFEIIDSRIESGIHQYTLKPKDGRMRGNVPWVFLDIDPARNELRALELELKDKSRIRTIFTNTKINPAIPASAFQPDLTGYKVD